MTVQECYEQMGGNYTELLQRLQNEERVRKYLEKFLKDSNYQELSGALSVENYRDAFLYAHNLKGLCANLGIGDLAKSSGDLCEALRNGAPEENPKALWEQVREDYERAERVIRDLFAEER